MSNCRKQSLEHMLGPVIDKKNTALRTAISVEERLTATPHCLATGVQIRQVMCTK
jgi:hypothetical protein